MEGRKAGGVLVVLRVPELLSSASLLIALIIGCSFLLHLCPYISVNVVVGAFSSEYGCQPCVGKRHIYFFTFSNLVSLKYAYTKG